MRLGDCLPLGEHLIVVLDYEKDKSDVIDATGDWIWWSRESLPGLSTPNEFIFKGRGREEDVVPYWWQTMARLLMVSGSPSLDLTTSHHQGGARVSPGSAHLNIPSRGGCQDPTRFPLCIFQLLRTSKIHSPWTSTTNVSAHRFPIDF